LDFHPELRLLKRVMALEALFSSSNVYATAVKGKEEGGCGLHGSGPGKSQQGKSHSSTHSPA